MILLPPDINISKGVNEMCVGVSMGRKGTGEAFFLSVLKYILIAISSRGRGKGGIRFDESSHIYAVMAALYALTLSISFVSKAWPDTFTAPSSTTR